MDKLGKELGIARQSLAMELCTDTLDAEKVIRVHTHVFCEFSSRIQIRSGGRFLFRLGAPHVSLEYSHGRGRSQKKSVCAGHYYVMCPKLGYIFQDATHNTFNHYNVNPLWITQLLQQSKISFISAREEFIRAAKGVAFHLRNLDTLVAEHRVLRMRKQT